MTEIILNPEEGHRLDWENSNWQEIGISFEDYLSILAQTALYESNAKGYERNTFQP